MTVYQNILFTSAIVSIILMCISNYVLAKITGKKFDRLLLENNIKLPSTFTLIPGTSEASMRAASYAMNIVLFGKDVKWRLRQKKDWYDSFNFLAHASKVDIFLSWIYELLLLLTIILSGIIIISAIFHIK